MNIMELYSRCKRRLIELYFGFKRRPSEYNWPYTNFTKTPSEDIKSDNNRIFISSTVKDDMVDIRAEVAESLKRWGFIPVLHEGLSDYIIESGLHDHDVCLDNVLSCDRFLLIINRRYGLPYDGYKYPAKNISITHYETEFAFENNKQVIAFVRDTVWTELRIYKSWKTRSLSQPDLPDYVPEYVEDVKVFDLIDYVDQQPRDNHMSQFKNSVELKKMLSARLGVSDAYELPYYARGRRSYE